MITPKLPIYTSHVPGFRLPDRHIGARRVAHLIAPPESLLTQTSIFPELDTYYLMRSAGMDLFTPGYYSAGFEPDQKAVSVSGGLLWLFSPSLLQYHVVRLKRFGWTPSDRPKIVIVSYEGFPDGTREWSYKHREIDIGIVGDQMPVERYVARLVETSEVSELEGLESAGSKLRELAQRASDPEVRREPEEVPS